MKDKSIYKKPNGAGKGDVPRPFSISRKEYEKRWEEIFRPKKKKWENHYLTIVPGSQMVPKKLDKVIATIQSEEQSYLKNTIRKNIEDKEDE